LGDGAPPAGSWVNVTANLANMPSQCGNMSYVSAKPDEDLLIAGIAELALWASRDGGQSWKALSASTDASATITNRTSSIIYDPSDATRYWESGLYNGGAAYETTDDGVTFTQLGSAVSSDLVSIDFTDPNRQTLLLGGHEQFQTLYRSTNGGTTWTPVGAKLPPSTNCTYPLVIDAQTHLVGCGGYGGGVSGVYRTTDGATTWVNVTSLGGSGRPLVASDGSFYWASPGGAGMARSTDKGLTWANPLAGSSSVASFSPIELPDGRIATIGPATGSQTIVVSADHGATWRAVSTPLPYADVSGFTYSSHRKAFYVWHFTCSSFTMPVPVPTDAIMAYSFDYQSG
jgi:photosystem II stability/assembly factor-like uncharacterized protein